MKKNVYSFIKSHNLVNRVYDQVYFLGVIKEPVNDKLFKNFFKKKLVNIDYVESLAKYFEKKLSKNNNNIELCCNLKDLIYDLNILKQYL